MRASIEIALLDSMPSTFSREEILCMFACSILFGSTGIEHSAKEGNRLVGSPMLTALDCGKILLWIIKRS